MSSKDVDIGDYDPQKEIFYWSSSFSIPNWANEKAYRQCFHCKDLFKSGKQHNCRLCGELFCSSCTSKYHLPSQFELKGKKGPTRVCYGCKNACIRIRDAHQGGYSRPAREEGTRIIPVPTWQNETDYVSCNKCNKKAKGPHNCRVCGLLYCSDCAQKVDIKLPLAFNKKNKTGPQRVCDECRFQVLSGDQLEDPSVGNFATTSTTTTSTTRGLRLGEEEQDSDEDVEAKDDLSRTFEQLHLKAAQKSQQQQQESQEDASNLMALTVRRIGQGAPVAVMNLAPTATLDDVNERLLSKCPELKSRALTYHVRGEAVSMLHWDMVQVRSLRGQLHFTEGVGIPLRSVLPVPVPSTASATSTPATTTATTAAAPTVAEHTKTEQTASAKAATPTTTANLVKGEMSETGRLSDADDQTKLTINPVAHHLTQQHQQQQQQQQQQLLGRSTQLGAATADNSSLHDHTRAMLASLKSPTSIPTPNNKGTTFMYPNPTSTTSTSTSSPPTVTSSFPQPSAPASEQPLMLSQLQARTKLSQVSKAAQLSVLPPPPIPPAPTEDDNHEDVENVSRGKENINTAVRMSLKQKDDSAGLRKMFTSSVPTAPTTAAAAAAAAAAMSASGQEAATVAGARESVRDIARRLDAQRRGAGGNN